MYNIPAKTIQKALQQNLRQQDNIGHALLLNCTITAFIVIRCATYPQNKKALQQNIRQQDNLGQALLFNCTMTTLVVIRCIAFQNNSENSTTKHKTAKKTWT